MAQRNTIDTPSGGGIQVIERAALILRLLERSRQALSLGEISAAVDLPRSTVQRIVGALAAERLVASGEAGRGVRLGPGLVSLGSAARSHFHGVIRPHLRRLSDELKETVDLSIRDGSVAVFIDQVISEEQQLRAVSGMGVSFPLHCCANGKALLAALSTAALDRALSSLELTRLTRNTLTSEAELRAELDLVRDQGVAYDREEQSLGICAVGAVVTDPYDGHMGISVAIPSTRFYGNEPELVEALLACRDRVQGELNRHKGA